MSSQRICIVTGTRAEWGLLSPIAGALRSRQDVELSIIATNMHLLPQYGHTIDCITDEGFTVDACVAMDAAGASPLLTARSFAQCASGIADAFARLQPDKVVILGDRTEMLATASTAHIMGIPVVHLHGGEISEGAIDDSIRHAITKLASLHLVATEEYRRRVIQLGEHPERVINTGAIGVYNAMHVPSVPISEIEKTLGFVPNRSTILVTFHPATLDVEATPGERAGELVKALKNFSDERQDVKYVITYPNNDPGSEEIIDRLTAFAAANPAIVVLIPSLGMKRYITLMRMVGAVAGNSSSGIIEVPSAGIPTIDIGIRQKGRLAAPSVIHCGNSAAEIERALRFALLPATQAAARRQENPYSRPDTLALIVEAIVATPLQLLKNKTFYDIVQ